MALSKRAFAVVLPALAVLQCAAGLDQVRSDQTKAAERITAVEQRLAGVEQAAAAAGAAEESRTAETAALLKQLRATLDRLNARLDSLAGVSRRQVLNLDSQLALLTDEIREFEIRMAGRTPGTKSGTGPAFDLRRAYSKGIRYYGNGKFREAIGAFRMADDVDVLPDLADNARYWTGECQYELGEYDDALASFERVLVLPQSNKLDDALLRMGRIYLKQGQRDEAAAHFRKLVAEHPESEYLKEAQEGILESTK